ncbi:hypothetical protein HY643_03320 [Candidatus Woesearchaeota archaeon]|nr:hypothetical protein [Candidatus Woesearchaeota archaeon]
MKYEYVLLSFLTFLAIAAAAFIIIPLFAIFFGLVFGTLGVIFSYGTQIGGFLIELAKFSWKFWPITLGIVAVLTTVFVIFTKLINE